MDGMYAKKASLQGCNLLEQCRSYCRGAFLVAMTGLMLSPTPSLRGVKRRGNLELSGIENRDCRATLIAMDGMYAKKASLQG
jgi:hypothetical protein